jgi:hypothetical protein
MLQAAAGLCAPGGSSSSSSSSRIVKQHEADYTQLVGVLFFWSVGLLLGGSHWYEPFAPPTSGPLVAPLAAAGDVSSRGALQLSGLLCSLLNMYSNSPSDRIPVEKIPVLGDHSGVNEQDVSTAIFTAVSCMLKAALDITSSGGQLDPS